MTRNLTDSHKQAYADGNISNRLEHCAKALFKTDWPTDDWDKFGANAYVKIRYRILAHSVMEALRNYNG